MHKHFDSAGRLLGSVALRYHQPLGARLSAWRLRECGTRRGDAGAERIGTGCPSERAALERGARSGEIANLEAVLFVAREPLGSRRLAQFAGLADGTQARTLVRRLNRLYDEQSSAFRVMEVAGGFQLLSRGKFALWLRRLHGAQVEIRLSAPTMETLAVVAYRQPVLRAEIEAIRGVSCGEILRQLMERDLVRIVGRSEELGRPFLYGTTRRFLQVFGLRHLDDLPRPELVRTRQTDTADAGADGRCGSQQPLLNPAVVITQTEGDSNVKIDVDSMALMEDAVVRKNAALLRARAESLVVAFGDEKDEDLDDDDSDDDDIDDEDDDEEEDDEDDGWAEVDDDDFDDDLDEDEDEDDDWDDDDEDEDEDLDEKK
jgi:segregation and condensation protein B